MKRLLAMILALLFCTASLASCTVLKTGGSDPTEAVADEVNRLSAPVHFTESTLGCARQSLVPHVDLP